MSRIPEEDAKLIAPYFASVDATSSGESVFYRFTNDSELVERVSNIVTANFGDLSEGLSLQSLFIATWYHIPAAGGLVEKVCDTHTHTHTLGSTQVRVRVM